MCCRYTLYGVKECSSLSNKTCTKMGEYLGGKLVKRKSNNFQGLADTPLYNFGKSVTPPIVVYHLNLLLIQINFCHLFCAAPDVSYWFDLIHWRGEVNNDLFSIFEQSNLNNEFSLETKRYIIHCHHQLIHNI